MFDNSPAGKANGRNGHINIAQRSNKGCGLAAETSYRTQASVCSVTEAAPPNIAFNSASIIFMRVKCRLNHPLLRGKPK